jgi:hypothetical protein
MIRNYALVLGTAASLTLLGATPAHAKGAPTAGHASVGALVGYGFKNETRFGLGVDAGYTLPMNLYLGGTFVYHLGPFSGDAKLSMYYFGFEGGYDIAAGPVAIRPYLGLGPVSQHYSRETLGQVPAISETETWFGFWPGARVLYPLGVAFIGADARYLFMKDYNFFSMFATGGVQF